MNHKTVPATPLRRNQYNIGDKIAVPFNASPSEKAIIHIGTIVEIAPYFVRYEVQHKHGGSYYECLNVSNGQKAVKFTGGVKDA